MCGNHSPDGTPIDHHHGHHQAGHHHGRHSGRAKQIFRPQPVVASRRAFLGNLGKGTMALAVVTPATLLAACGSSDADRAEPPALSTPESSNEPAADAETSTAPVEWTRVNLGFVSAYVLTRGNTAAIVDTGVAGSADAIGQSLNELGLNYSDVAHVILTHNHADHAGSIQAVLDQAVNATAYAGEEDLGGIAADVTGVIDGQDVFGFEMIHTPGHTPGHMAVFDRDTGLLVAGDAIFTEDGGVVEGPERFFDDVDLSRQSIKAMAALDFGTLLVGHGDPLEGDAQSAVAALAATL